MLLASSETKLEGILLKNSIGVDEALVASTLGPLLVSKTT